MPRKTVSINLSKLAVKDPDKLIEYLSRALKTSFVRLEIRGSRLIIELAGDSASIRTSMIRLKKLLSELKVVERKGVYVYPPNLIYKEAGMAVPLDVVAEVLKAYGYKASYTSEGLETNAPLEEAVNAASAVAGALESMKAYPLTTSARKAVAAVSAITSLAPSDVISAGLSSGVLVEERERLSIKGSWRDAYKRLMESIEGAGGGAGNG